MTCPSHISTCPPASTSARRRHWSNQSTRPSTRPGPFPDDTRIFLNEWPLDSVSQNGLLGSEPARPVFIMHIPQGADPDAKRKVLKKINTAVADAYHLPDFMIFIQEYPMDRVAENGRLVADNQQRADAQTAAYS